MGYGYPIEGTVDQSWSKFTGRAVANWTPKLPFTDQSLFYASFAHGYKAGGANPPGARLLTFNAGETSDPIHPLTFKPEFVNAFELGTKNALLDGGVTLNANAFFYDYSNYQISRIVDRTAINDNFDAKVKGAELEASYEPISGLKFRFAGGYEDTRINDGQSSIDLIDRTDSANHPDWMVVKPFVGQASNCILPVYVVAALVAQNNSLQNQNSVGSACAFAYIDHADPVTQQTYQFGVTNDLYPKDIPISSFSSETYSYAGFDPATAPNNGEGFAKSLGGNELPNAPHFTTSLSADWTLPVSEEWVATIHSDFYWQSQSWARVFNDQPYDKIRGYSNVNLALILTSASGWQVMGYLKNVFDTTAITGDFLNSDDSGLTTNVFLTDPRLFGVRVTKNW
jgi:outer membrane receptor protein involved in Fe transport